ncbi:hypothetical protein [Sorangium sp. So ce854]|uniref:hypothetical protein n=1 Tax=Sorangium sp. So ce854 TaxID=3133322 RepID=UPI003F5EAB4D
MRRSLELVVVLSAAVLGACADDEGGGEAGAGTGGGGAAGASASGTGGAASGTGGAASGTGGAGTGGAGAGSPAHEGGGPAAGNPDGACAVPAEAQAADTSSPTTVIGDGTPESCTSAAVVDAVAGGGVITFDCGPDPITITLEETAKIFNDTGPEIVIDGGGLVTLSGGGERRILYMNTCDEAQVWTTPNCDNQDHPRLTIQNLTFIEGDSTGEDDEGGGAVFAQGGRLKVVNSRFFNNACDPTGPDVGGAGIRAFMQHDGLPLYVVNSTFGGAEGYGNACANGGGISSIGVSWTVINSLFSHNRAIGNGGNPAESGTPGGGSGGAIYNDGNTMTLTLCGTRIERNEVNAHGSAIFFVSNDHSGNIVIDRSVITNNVGGSWYPTYPQISNHDDTPITVTDSTIE